MRKQQKAMEARKEAGSIFGELNALAIRFADFAYPVYLLQSVAPDKTTRDAAQACLEKVLPFETELYQSAELYQRVKAVKPKDLTDTVYQQDLFEKFEDGGATLPPEKRKRAKEILERTGAAWAGVPEEHQRGRHHRHHHACRGGRYARDLDHRTQAR